MAIPDSNLGISVDFPEADVRNAFAFAMQLGKNPDPTRQVIFIRRASAVTYWQNGTELVDTPRLDRDGSPFDPTIEVRRAVDERITGIDCAVEVEDVIAQDTGVGVFRPTKLTTTLVDGEYAKIKDCRELDYNGDRYVYAYEPESDGLFGIGVYQMVWNAKDET